MDTEPSFEDLLSAVVSETDTDASAVDDPSAALSDLVSAVFGDDVAPDLDVAPDEDENAAALEPEATEESEDDEPSEVDLLRQQVQEYEQQARDAQAKAAEAEAREYWESRRRQADAKLAQALTWLQNEAQSGRHYDTTEFILQNLPTIVQGYTADVEAVKDEQIRAVWNIARQHGSQTYLQALQSKYTLSSEDLTRVRKYPPELMEQVARDIVEARGTAVAPVAQELTTAKTKLSKTETALRKQRRSQQITPGGVVPSATIRDVKARITPDNAGDIAGSLFAAIGLKP